MIRKERVFNILSWIIKGFAIYIVCLFIINEVIFFFNDKKVTKGYIYDLLIVKYTQVSDKFMNVTLKE